MEEKISYFLIAVEEKIDPKSRGLSSDQEFERFLNMNSGWSFERGNDSAYNNGKTSLKSNVKVYKDSGIFQSESESISDQSKHELEYGNEKNIGIKMKDFDGNITDPSDNPRNSENSEEISCLDRSEEPSFVDQLAKGYISSLDNVLSNDANKTYKKYVNQHATEVRRHSEFVRNSKAITPPSFRKYSLDAKKDQQNQNKNVLTFGNANDFVKSNMYNWSIQGRKKTVDKRMNKSSYTDQQIHQQRLNVTNYNLQTDSANNENTNIEGKLRKQFCLISLQMVYKNDKNL